MNIKAGLVLAPLLVVALQVTDAAGDQKLCDMLAEWAASVSQSGASIRDDDVRQRLRMDIENKLSTNNVQNFPQEAEKVNKIKTAAHVLLAERSEYYTIAFRFGADLAKGSLERALEAESVLLGSCGG
ncbi:MAG: hypothetical protein ACLP5H_14400, partial [Desulfomonilaceae bacterium]